MKVVELFVIVTILCLGSAGWWYAGTYLSELTDLGFSGVVQMTQEVVQGLYIEAREVVASR